MTIRYLGLYCTLLIGLASVARLPGHAFPSMRDLAGAALVIAAGMVLAFLDEWLAKRN